MGILKDGIGSRISINIGNAFYAEIEITPPEVDGRGGIDMTSLRNRGWITMAPKSLKALNAMTARVQYDPIMYGVVIGILQRNRQMSVTFPDGGVLTFWGWIDKFTPEGMSEGNKPTATLTIQPSNLDQQCNEVGPSYASGQSTTCV
jgi:hypothetical protein